MISDTSRSLHREVSVDDFSSSGYSVSSHASDQKRSSPNSSWVSWFRFALGVAVLCASVAVPFLIHHILRGSERRSFERDFFSFSSQAKESFGINFARMLSAADTLSTDATSHALHTGSDWPLVTLDHFAQRAESLLVLSEAGLLADVHPFVSNEDRRKWEKYVANNHEWMNRVGEYQNTILSHNGLEPVLPLFKDKGIFNDEGFSEKIYEFNSNISTRIDQFQVDDTEGPYFPSWQSYPITLHTVNYNYRSFTPSKLATNFMLKSERPVIQSAEVFTDQGTADHFTNLLRIITRDPSVFYEGQPISNFHYPIFDTFDLDTREMVGGVTLVLFWPLYFSKLLPPETPPITCYVSSTCGLGFSMRIEGGESVYLGQGDHHNLGTHIDTYDLDEVQHHPKFTFSKNSVPLDVSACSFRLHFYPTEELREEYISNEPITAALIAGVTLMVFGLVLLSYGRIVRRRFRRILREAIKSGNYVSSIFPEHVRLRLMAIAAENKKAQEAAAKDGTLLAKPGYSTPLSAGASICDSYANCTVFFAKLTGVANWSSSHDPHELFGLLEAVFQAMDRVACRRNVFKVETIAETYLAITGLPNPQSDHAWRMARFACECNESVKMVLANISESLGPDTKDLKLQIGMHSGPVTGGVMGGQQKARFQVFGDTVNSASRLMSTGVAGRIQLSKETAQIIGDESDHWRHLQKRKGGVYAKGKGSLETYFLEQRSASHAS